MSIPVDVADLAKALEGFGAGYLLTTAAGTVKVVTVEPTVTDGVVLVEGPGKGTVAQPGREHRGHAGLPAAASRRGSPCSSTAPREVDGRRRPGRPRPARCCTGRPATPTARRRPTAAATTAPRSTHDPALARRVPRPPGDTHEAGADFWSAVTGFRAVRSAGSDGRVRHAGAARRRPTTCASSGSATDAPRVHLDVHVDDPARRGGRGRGLGATVLESPTTTSLTLTLARRLRRSAWSPSPAACARRRRDVARRPHVVRRPGLPRHPAQPLRRRAATSGTPLTGWQRRDPRPGRSSAGSPRPGPAAPAAAPAARRRAGHGHRPPRLGRRPTTRPSWPRTSPRAPRCRPATSGWTVLRDPAGLIYCVTRRRPGDRPRMNDEIGEPDPVPRGPPRDLPPQGRRPRPRPARADAAAVRPHPRRDGQAPRVRGGLVVRPAPHGRPGRASGRRSTGRPTPTGTGTPPPTTPPRSSGRCGRTAVAPVAGGGGRRPAARAVAQRAAATRRRADHAAVDPRRTWSRSTRGTTATPT